MESVKKLIKSNDFEELRRWFPGVDNMLNLRRSPSSSLLEDIDGKKVPLTSLMPPHIVRTLEITYNALELVDMQYAHRAAARYITFILV